MLLVLANAFVAGALVTTAAPPAIRAAAMDAPNAWKIPLPEASMARACQVFDEALLPHLRQGLIAQLDQQPLPCTAIDSVHGRYFVMRAGSSTNEELRDSSDLAKQDFFNADGHFWPCDFS